MKLDLLVFAVHPDDAELGCSGTIVKHVKQGKKIGIVDLTRGELGTRGSADLRDKEAEVSAKVLGLSARENLCFADGFFENNKAHQLEIIKMIRKYQPQIILANALEDRHPDHGRAGTLVRDSIFLSGLRKIETAINGSAQEPWRPNTVFHYIQDRYLKPDFVVDISAEMNTKIESIKAFSSQFFDPAAGNSGDPQTYISSPTYFESIIARARELGKPIGAEFGEGFKTEKFLGVDDLFLLR